MPDRAENNFAIYALLRASCSAAHRKEEVIAASV
jgi:hypothetical protein